MNKNMRTYAVWAAIVLAPVGPVRANSLVAPGEHRAVARSSIATTTTGQWNKLSRSDGPGTETWTRDGDSLNKIVFFGGITAGMPIFKDTNRKLAPLPKVADGMLLPDIPVLLESTYRSRYQVNRMAIDTQDVAEVAGKQAIRFTYSYVRADDEVERKGEAIGTMAGNKLYLVTYEAPAIYFYAKDLADFRQIVRALRF